MTIPYTAWSPTAWTRLGVLHEALSGGELIGSDSNAATLQLLETLLDSTATAVFCKDLNSRFLGCNRVCAQFAGVDPELMIGMTDRELPWADNPGFPAEWFMKWDKLVIETGESRFGIREQLRSADGTIRWVETNKVPLRDVRGEIIGVLGTFEDVTDRLAAEHQLQQTLDDLDERVRRRTQELVRANESLRREVEDRVRLQAEERQQRAYAEALRDTASAIAKTLDLDEVTEEVLGGVRRLVTNDLTALFLCRPDDSLELAGLRHGSEYPIDAAEGANAHSLSVIRELLDGRGPVVVERPSRALGGAASTIGARMQVADQLVGYVIVESSMPSFFTESHAERLSAVADHAGAAISNAQLVRRISQLGAAEERQRVAQELHDAVNQTLWTATLTAEGLLSELAEGSAAHHKVQRLRQLTRGALGEMRTLLIELRPSQLAQVQLDELIGHLVAAVQGRHHLDVAVSLEPVDLEEAAHLVYYRVAQEAISNATRHARATHLTVDLRALPSPTLTVRDDGGGFDPHLVPAGRMGLTIMAERAASIGAALTIHSAPGQGTIVQLQHQGVLAC